MFCGDLFEFLMYARSASSRSGTEIYGNRSEPPRSNTAAKRTAHEYKFKLPVSYAFPVTY